MISLFLLIGGAILCYVIYQLATVMDKADEEDSKDEFC